MKTTNKQTARELRSKIIKVIWIGANRLGVDPREFAPQRKGVTGEEGSTLSACTLEELQQIAFRIKAAGGRLLQSLWVPSIPAGMRRLASPLQLTKLKQLLARQTYLNDPDQFFKLRLKIKDPANPTFAEAKRMISYLVTKERQCA